MGYALEENELLSFAVKRIAVEQIDLALDHLKAEPADLNESIHATRQSLKRLRALVLLTRGELGAEVFQREWKCYRKAGRLLARARDAAVVVQTLDSLLSRFSNELSADAFAMQRRYLAERRDTQITIMVQEEGVLQKAFEVLGSARERVATWPMKRRGFKVLREGATHSYRTGRKDIRSVVRHPSPTNFHRWRRPVKLLWHQLQILTPIWPVILNAHAEELRALSDRLNENHDLDAFRHAALWSQCETQPPEQQALISLVDRRSRELEAEALLLGERLYTERPTRFMHRIEHYWCVWKRRQKDSATVSDATESIVAVSAGR
jgi:CHAD domain-containing protein